MQPIRESASDSTVWEPPGITIGRSLSRLLYERSHNTTWHEAVLRLPFSEAALPNGDGSYSLSPQDKAKEFIAWWGFRHQKWVTFHKKGKSCASHYVPKPKHDLGHDPRPLPFTRPDLSST